MLFLTTLKYNSNKFLRAKIKPKYKIKEVFFHPLNIEKFSQKKKMCVCSGGKLTKRSQVLYRSDQGKYFLKINQNYFAHICPEYSFRVNCLLKQLDVFPDSRNRLL